MSMISAQIDELRQMADGQATYRDARAVMLQAADTIWELRDDLQRANAENAKLREDRDGWKKVCVDQEVMHVMHEEMLDNDNAKLRELVRKVLQFERAGCEGCPYASTCDVDCLYEPNCPMREDIERDMRELEVDACPNCGAKVVEPTKNDVDVEVEQ